MPDNPQALFLSPDLMFASRITAAARQLGSRCDVAPSLNRALELLAAPRPATDPLRLLIVDLEAPALDLPTLVAATNERHIPIVAYASHVREQLLAAATQLGCTEVHPRSRFNAQLDSILAKFLSPNATNHRAPT